MANTHSYQICAVDGGGTGCRAVIARADGTVLARASGGPANYATDAAQAVKNVLCAVHSAAQRLGIEGSALHRLVAHVGLAGIMSAADAQAVASQLAFEICSVTDDRETSVIGALGARDGALLAIGTGTFLAARRGDKIRFFGGWGLNVGDQASGARLGRELLERTLLACDGIETDSDLTRAILSRFEGAPANITAFAGSAKPADFAAFAPLVINAAKAGDPVGHALMERGAAYLNAALGSAGVSEDEIVCLIGGVGPLYEPYLAPEYRDRIRPPEGEALDGAVQLARRKLEEVETPA